MRSISFLNRTFSGSSHERGDLKKTRQTINDRRAGSLLICMVACLAALLLPAEAGAFNKFEVKIMTENIQESFTLLIDTWKEELYFEMYDFGQRTSQRKLTRSEFAQRMVELKWKPSLKPIEIDRIELLYHNYAVIYFWQEFVNKVNTLRTIRKYMTFPTILEGGQWKFDLTQLIRIPYEGKFQKPQPETEKEEKPAPDSAAATDQQEGEQAAEQDQGQAGEQNP